MLKKKLSVHRKIERNISVEELGLDKLRQEHVETPKEKVCSFNTCYNPIEYKCLYCKKYFCGQHFPQKSEISKDLIKVLPGKQNLDAANEQGHFCLSYQDYLGDVEKINKAESSFLSLKSEPVKTSSIASYVPVSRELFVGHNSEKDLDGESFSVKLVLLFASVAFIIGAFFLVSVYYLDFVKSEKAIVAASHYCSKFSVESFCNPKKFVAGGQNFRCVWDEVAHKCNYLHDLNAA